MLDKFEAAKWQDKNANDLRVFVRSLGIPAEVISGKGKEQHQMVQMDLTALRREGYRQELRLRADHVHEAQLGPQGGDPYDHGGGEDKMAALALKMAGKSPTSLPYFSMICVDSKTSRVGAAAAAFTKFEAESRTWHGTVYGLDRVGQRPLCSLLHSSLTPDLVTEILYAPLEAAQRLISANTYAGFKEALLQVLIELDLGTSSISEPGCSKFV